MDEKEWQRKGVLSYVMDFLINSRELEPTEIGFKARDLWNTIFKDLFEDEIEHDSDVDQFLAGLVYAGFNCAMAQFSTVMGIDREDLEYALGCYLGEQEDPPRTLTWEQLLKRVKNAPKVRKIIADDNKTMNEKTVLINQLWRGNPCT